MSSATLVPETRNLSGDDAWRALRKVGAGKLAKEGWERMRAGDGFTHARSFAFMLTLMVIEGLIGLVGLSSVIKSGRLSKVIADTIRRTVPGPAGQILTTAVHQAHHVANGHHYLALTFGIVGTLYVATTAMGQLERGLNRLYGVEEDRPALKKYSVAFVLALGLGTLSAASFVCLALGRYLFGSAKSDALSTIWAVVRWPLGLLLLTITVTVLFRYSPRRRQPKLSWLAFGSGVSVLLWALATAALGVFYSTSPSFGTTYGPLAGDVALMVWSLFSSSALFYGAAIAAQLEAHRGGASQVAVKSRTTKKCRSR